MFGTSSPFNFNDKSDLTPLDVAKLLLQHNKHSAAATPDGH